MERKKGPHATQAQPPQLMQRIAAANGATRADDAFRVVWYFWLLLILIMIVLPNDSEPVDKRGNSGSTNDVNALLNADEPPTYTDAVGGANNNSSAPFVNTSGEKDASRLYNSPTPPISSSSAIADRSRSQPSGSSSLSWWFSFGALSRTDKEVKATVLGLIRDVVKQSSSPASISILQSCAEACRARQLSFDAIIQEPSIEGHTPLYWAILKRKSPSSRTDVDDEVGVLDMLLSFPLLEATRTDASIACVIQSDNVLFQRLRNSPGWKSAVHTGTDEMLLGELPEDTVEVTNDVNGADNGAFKANFHVAQFQKRMRVTKAIHIEFIARERLWVLRFTREAPRFSHAGNSRNSSGGFVNLYLIDPSPPTPLRGKITIMDPTGSSSTNSRKAVKPIVIPLKSGHSEMSAQRRGSRYDICSALGDIPGGASLQHDGSSYINVDGSIDFEMAAVLAESDGDPECTIM